MTDSLQTASTRSGGSVPAGRTVRLAAALLASECAGVLAVALRDPHVMGSWGACPLLSLTGRPCPFCGGLRATHDLAAGHVAQAMSENAFGAVAVVGGVAFTAVWLLAAARAARRGQVDPAARVDDRLVVAVSVGFIALWVAFGLLRLTAPLAWLQP